MHTEVSFNPFPAVLLPILWLLAGCASPRETGPDTLLNTAHLDHLYEEVRIDSQTVGTIWIYAEAPDYHLVKDEDEGFTCVDDVARALVFYCRQYPRSPSEEIRKKIHALTGFLLFMQAENGYFYNFLLPGPRVNKTHQNSQANANWWSWRAFWALSEVCLLESESWTDLQSRCRPVMEKLLRNMYDVCPPPGEPRFFEGVATPDCLADLGADQAAVMMMGLTNHYRVAPSGAVRALLLSLGELLLEVQRGDAAHPPHFAFLSWRNYWHAWGNLQAYALLYAGRILEHAPFVDAGLKEVRHFYPYCLEQGFMAGFSMTAENDQLVVKKVDTFPQIAYGIRPMIYASLEAYAVTGDTTFAGTAGRLATWFFGNNPAGRAMYDPATGRTFDGIGAPDAVNDNAGAESTIEGLLSLQAMENVPAAREVLELYLGEGK